MTRRKASGISKLAGLDHNSGAHQIGCIHGYKSLLSQSVSQLLKVTHISESKTRLIQVPMARCLLSLALLGLFALLTLLHEANGCGMPPAPPPAPMCCCGGGRKKREAVQPHIKTKDIPCPQAEWRQLMEQAIIGTDANGSVHGIQSALLRRFPNEKFLVVCAVASGEQAEPKFIGDTPVPNQVHLSASGDGYCNVISDRIWCQAAAVSA